ncbi:MULTISPECIES: peptidylprolyl isomerase [unclassified Aureispira]|uniref:peptidylprolyl isomerase n=1 Tax=unclassified Aureispira TaxID=2649989 RepID=UPI000698E24A|nr:MULTISPECIES: peptidylprolyl isomerase [unclassified Aureispira]WMX15772.1 peptidylprolyl isomerase [Aureispira sp. CCB-E]
MALLGTIRNRFGWVMMALVFVGVASFLFMDISPGANTASGRSATVGYVNGEKVSNDLVQEYASDYKGAGYLQEEIQAQVWERIVGEKLLTQKTNEAGMLVTPTEMGDLFLSEDPRLLSPVVQSRLADPKTRQINRPQIKQMIELYKNTGALMQQAGGNKQQQQQLLEQQKEWLALEKSVKTRALQDKYFVALEKGIYTPSWMVEMENKLQETGYNFDYVRIPYTSIKDKVEVSEQEMKEYISNHARQYKRKATANIEYVVFDVKPTSEDSMYYYTSMEERAQELRDAKTTKEDSSVVLQYTRDFAPNFYTRTEMPAPASMIDSIFGADEGTVFGPYVEGQKYKVLKKVKEKNLPDSVRARHILIRAEDPTAGQNARILLDSIKNVLETDPTASFDSLAMQFSQDGSSSKGGDLGWQGKDVSFVPQFKEYMFYTGEKDSLEILYTQFGVHLIQITDTKYETDRVGIRIAVLEEAIIPTSKTTETKKREAVEFIANNRTLEEMKKAAKEKGLTLSPATGLEKGAYEISGLGKNSTAASIITWAHLPETKAGEVTGSAYAVDNDELGYTEKFVVMGLSSKVDAGLATIEDPQVRADVETILRNKKKTEVVKNKLGTLTSLDAIAGAYGVIKQSATNVQYGSANVGTDGTEPKVAGLAANTEVGQMSGAVGGKTGVYIVQVTSRNEAPPIANVKTAREKVTRRISQAVSSGVYENIKENAEIVDERIN